MSLDPIHLSYELSRRQRLVAHLGTWLCYWPALLMMVGVAIVVTLAVRKSPWFLVILLLPPMMNNVPRFIAGCVSPLFSGRLHMDLVIEKDRIGYRFGQDRQWLPLEEIVRIERFGDVWVIVSSGPAIDIPVSAVDEKYIAHMRAISKKRQESARPTPRG
jgi:hypothetical protein